MFQRVYHRGDEHQEYFRVFTCHTPRLWSYATPGILDFWRHFTICCEKDAALVVDVSPLPRTDADVHNREELGLMTTGEMRLL